jgi:outer membrane protein TolC
VNSTLHVSRFTFHALRKSLALSLLIAAATASAQTTNQTSPIDLPTALRLAGAQNLDVQIARQRLAEAKANHQSTVWQFFPWISPGAGYRRHDDLIQDVAGNVIEVHKESYTLGPTIAAQVDLGDTIYKNLASRQVVKAADYGLESQRLESILAAAQGYFDLAKAVALSGVIYESLRISRDYQQQLHEGVLAGIAFKGDELRVQVQTERYQLALRQSLEQERLAAARLAQILRLDPAIVLAPQEAELAPLTLIQTNAVLDSLVNQALRSRPEISQSKALASAAQDARNGALYGPLIPSVGAQVFLGGLGGGKDSGPSTFGSSEDYVLGLSWRIGPGGLFDVGRARAAQARLQISRLTNDKVADEITRQVVEGLTRAQSLADQLLTARTNLATASETLRLTRERKQFGVGAVLEDIQAQQELTRARSDYLALVAEYNKAQYALKKATGQL